MQHQIIKSVVLKEEKGLDLYVEHSQKAVRPDHEVFMCDRKLMENLWKCVNLCRGVRKLIPRLPIDAIFIHLFGRMKPKIEVQLPLETKTIEWNKAHPTFQELKERLRQCGIATAKNWCVEVERGGEFLSLDDDDLLDGPKMRVRASKILCKTSWKRPKPNEPPKKNRPKMESAPPWEYHNRYEELFVEGVIPFVGRVFVLPKKFDDICLEDCTGTVGLVGANGESIGAFHSVRKAWRHPQRYDVYIKYMNHEKQPCFPAKVTVYNEELDLFIAAPLPPFEYHFPKFLQPASGVSVGDTVHCLGFPKLIDEEVLSQIKEFVCDKPLSLAVQEGLEFPAVFSGKTCFSGWKQVLADYRSFPNCSGAVIVDDNGHLKGIHISSLSAAEFEPEMGELENSENNTKRTRKLYQRVNTCFPQIIAGVGRNAEAAVFVPINVLMKTLNPAMSASTKAILYS